MSDQIILTDEQYKMHVVSSLSRMEEKQDSLGKASVLTTEKLAQHGEALQRLETEQKTFRKELLGNGQPGQIQKIEARLLATETKVSAINVKIAKYAGAIGVAMLLLGAIAKHYGF